MDATPRSSVVEPNRDSQLGRRQQPRRNNPEFGSDSANGTQLQLFGNLPLQGSQSYQITQHGVHHFTVHVSYTFGIETRTGTMSFDVHVV